ncbi:hypothetical protein QR685DRAFT_76381 [Neurospora intermedia]|uniref:Uncharacterized protein n=1 Tax=Neurospora intermedia TaxID=5142 RepID=A0ABR3D337_NEUIN
MKRARQKLFRDRRNTSDPPTQSLRKNTYPHPRSHHKNAKKGNHHKSNHEKISGYPEEACLQTNSLRKHRACHIADHDFVTWNQHSAMAQSEPTAQENGQRAGIFDFVTTPLLYATETRRRRGFAGCSSHFVFPYINIVRALLGHFIFEFLLFGTQEHHGVQWARIRGSIQAHTNTLYTRDGRRRRSGAGGCRFSNNGWRGD